MSAEQPASDESGRQHIEQVRGSRRARLTAAPGTTAEPVAADETSEAEASGPNDEQMRRDKPPHY